MNKGNLSRRGFLQRSIAAMAAAGLPAWYARQVLAAEEEKAAKTEGLSANDKIIMGAIGIGSPQARQRDLVNAARRHKGVEYVAACDVDGRHLERGARMIGPDCAKFKDFRELLDRKDINAVTIAVPDHWHALIAIDALRKGKDVYCEKPLTLTIAEGKALVKVAKQTGRVFQVGSQQRSDRRFRLACELVRNGRLGKIKTVETRIGANPTCEPIPVVEVPKELDWNFWLGPAPKADYVYRQLSEGRADCRHPYEFRWFYEYSGGKMTDWGAHHNDIAQWGLGMDDSGPVAIEATGSRPSNEPNSYNCHPTFKVTYTYANGARLICSNTQLKGSPDPKETRIPGRNGRQRMAGHDNGVLFVGEGGQWIFVNRELITASDPKLIEEPLPSNATKLYHSDDHMGNFLDCVRKGSNKTICPAEVGHRSVTVCHLGVIALRSGKKLKWDPVKEQFVGDREANRWLSREMRPPWKLEV